jgi:hypothetical protein
VRYSCETRASVTEIMQRARRHFGPEGVGLQQTATSVLEVTYTSPAGTVEIGIVPAGDCLNEVVVSSQSFDAEAAQFARQLPPSTLVQRVRRAIRSNTRPSTRP